MSAPNQHSGRLAQHERASRRVALRQRIDESGDPELLDLIEERDFLEMSNCGWREISGEWASLARRLVPEDFDFGHGCATCTIGRVLDHLAVADDIYRNRILELADQLDGPMGSSVDLEIAMKLRALATGDYSEVEARAHRIVALQEENGS